MSTPTSTPTSTQTSAQQSGPRDTLGVPIQVGDTVRVTSWGAPVRLNDTGRTAVVAGFSRSGNVVLADDGDSDPIARGRSVRPGYLAVQRRDGAQGHEGNRTVTDPVFVGSLMAGGRYHSATATNDAWSCSCGTGYGVSNVAIATSCAQTHIDGLKDS